jgi:ATP-dependent DNA helicase RecG
MNARLVGPLMHLTGGDRLFDLLTHLPIDTVTRSTLSDLSDAKAGTDVLLNVIVVNHQKAFRRGMPYRVICQDGIGNKLGLVFFNAKGPYLEKLLPLNEAVTVSGTLDQFRGAWQITHPDISKTPPNPDKDKAVNALVHEPIYPLTQGITMRVLRGLIGKALDKAAKPPEWLDDTILKAHHFPALLDGLTFLHHPQTGRDLIPEHPARQRLAFDELLSHQLALSLVRQNVATPRGRSYPHNGPLRQKLVASLPFTLTPAQNLVLSEIDGDMAASTRMLRLLQGDVGSGKTIVAALSMMNALDAGAQAVLMAPTEILARQHAATLHDLLTPLGVRMVCLTGRDKGKTRQVLLKQIADGTAQVIVGTHAVFQDQVSFADLGLAVIDEQHRFGVHQRLQLSGKGDLNDVLVMTATPIPRTLALTLYGDMDISKLDAKPPGRKPIDTRLVSTDRLGEMVAAIKRQLEQGAQAYWVCPLVAESEMLDLAAAEERYADLQHHFGAEVGLLHGQMKDSDKEAVMAKFCANEIKVLVATTVIEVGVNVPNANVMIIEHAERFGLAQLHQLRGRVGRGERASYCILIHDGKLSEGAKQRLQMMRATEDGFLLAEKDMELRGSGDILGTRQSGIPDFKLVDFNIHRPLLELARDQARYILSRDPHLKSEQGKALQMLLQLYRRDNALSLIGAG